MPQPSNVGKLKPHLDTRQLHEKKAELFDNESEEYSDK